MSVHDYCSRVDELLSKYVLLRCSPITSSPTLLAVDGLGSIVVAETGEYFKTFRAVDKAVINLHFKQQDKTDSDDDDDDDDDDEEEICLCPVVAACTGSIAEIYIRPIVPVFGDVDVMYYGTMQLVLPSFDKEANCTLATIRENIGRWLADSGTVLYFMAKLELMIPCPKQPGYVRLIPWGLLIWSLQNNNYDVIYHGTADNEYVKNQISTDIFSTLDAERPSRRKGDVHGPAAEVVGLFMYEANVQGLYSTDNDSVGFDHVHCCRCPVWPQQAAQWPWRSRVQGFPGKKTVDEIVRLGCDVVATTHRDCRDDIYQWRLSFSRAEVVLLNQWTPLQQMTYLSLRLLIKKTIFQVNEKSKYLMSNYHVKTLMLWACETNEAASWSRGRLIEVCLTELKKFSSFLERRHCPSYFVDDSNLFSYEMDEELFVFVTSSLEKCCNRSTLCEWFIENYVLDSFMEHEDQIVFRTAPLTTKLDIIDESVEQLIEDECQPDAYLSQLRQDISTSVSMLHTLFERNPDLEPINYRSMLLHIQQFNPRVRDYLIALVLLQRVEAIAGGNRMIISAELTNGSDANDDCLVLIQTLVLLFNNQTHRSYSDIYRNPLSIFQSSTIHCYLVNALNALRLIAGEMVSKTDSTLLELLVIQCLQTVTTRCSNSDQRQSIFLEAATYLAALQYHAGSYQQAFETCNDVLDAAAGSAAVDTDKFSDYHLIEAALLPASLEEAVTVSGLLATYDSIEKRAAAGCCQNRCLVFSTPLFVRYVRTKCLMKLTETRADVSVSVLEANEIYRTLVYGKGSGNTCMTLSAGDVLLYELTASKIVGKNLSCLVTQQCNRIASWSKVSTTSKKDDVRNLLTLAATERLTAFRQTLKADPDIGRHYQITTHYTAMYWFQTGNYEQCLEVCDEIVDNFPVPEKTVLDYCNVNVIPPMSPLLDSQLISVFALLLLYYLEEYGNDANATDIIKGQKPNVLLSPYGIACYLQIRSLTLCDSSSSSSQGHRVKLAQSAAFLRYYIVDCHHVGAKLEHLLLMHAYQQALRSLKKPK